MIHLRIVVPSDRADGALELLDHTDSAINIVYMQGAARKPAGDVILCDVAREDVSVVISDLKEMGVHEDGSIAIEEIDSQVSRAAEEAERAAPGLPSDAVVWEEVESRTEESTELSGSFLAFMTISTLLAAVAILTDQIVLLIGAMVVGPEFGPLAGLCVAIVQRRGDVARRSARALLVGFPVAILASFVMVVGIDIADLVPDDFTEDDHPFTAFISNPDGYSFVVAILAGVTGVLSLTSTKSTAVIGVLVSVTTIPSAANIGLALALGSSEWAGAAAQLAINLSAIVLAGVATLFLQRKLYMRRRVKHLSDPVRRLAGLPVGRSRHSAHGPEDADA